MPDSDTNRPAEQPALNYRIGDERVIRVTQDAADKVHSLLKRQGRPDGVLRIAVIGGGCSGLQYKIDLQDEPAARDILVISKDTKIVIDPKSVLYVSGSELDYVDALQGAGFKVHNPHATSTCACGESFSA
ncbi:MAG: iron-sulfur cluster assembly accessory protein [Verrucomicrobia bacterium]|nr:iron-sulfur cluster assembly accessory protein [Verrucomicrobiota bacterium]MBO4714604.1 iron-sulfur cluster assembly accessory protein [Verrucomicrobiota bacterium]MBR5605066.1 iron-sulfur cluster assembly accessory protein [Verrucomicrobiota bacterium]MBR5690913.1 iron-sulfur cluster assembly accessory protein [Verrucomicrobiota bacterium]MBR5737428.1 iron-sulfur cluster assembly accessory protein [Verrucomicrobiota bacterium]